MNMVLWPLRVALWLPVYLMYRYSREPCGEVWVVNDALGDGSRDFRDQVDRALRFIRKHHPRRADRVEQHIDYIDNCSITDWWGQYSPSFKICSLDYEAIYKYVVGRGELAEDSREVLTMHLASVIVHEATHGRIADAGIRYNRRYRERIERACYRQEFSFMRRAAGGFCDACGRPIDWGDEYDFEPRRDEYIRDWSKSDRSVWAHLCALLRDGRNKESRVTDTSWREQHRRYWDFVDSYRPWTLSMLYTRGAYHAAANNHRLAIDDFRRVLERDPDDTKAQIGLATQLVLASRYEEALGVWFEADARGREDASIGICQTLWRLNRPAQALEWLDRGADGGESKHRVGFRGMLLLELGLHEEAARELSRTLKDQEATLGSDEFSYLAMLTHVLQVMGREHEYLTMRRRLASSIERWRQSSETKPVETAAYVLRTRPAMYGPGSVTSRARLLVSPDASDSPVLRDELGRIADLLLTRMDSDSIDYEDVYLRSLLSRNEKYPWRQVPESLAGDGKVWVVDLNLDRIFLPGARLHGNWVKCLISQSSSRYSACLDDRSLELGHD